MNIALIEARDPERPTFSFLPTGLAYLAAWLKRYSSEQHSLTIYENYLDIIAAKPDLVGISAVSPNFPYATTIATEISESLAVPLILGGPHISCCPESLPAVFIAGVLGEGEVTFQELVETIALLQPHSTISLPLTSAGRQTTKHTAVLANIPGIVYHGASGPCITKPRPLLQSLDDIPFPLSGYQVLCQDHTTALPPSWSFSSRGCPYRCRFCSTAHFWHSFRQHSAHYVVEEVALHKQLSPLNLHVFMDDLFVSNVKRLAQIYELLQQQRLLDREYVVNIRADLVTDAIAALLVKMGVTFCHIGFESGSERVLSFLKKETIQVEVNQRALDIMSRHGLNIIGSFIIGAPNEEESDISQTYRFIADNLANGKLASFSFGPLVAFPGTEVWQYAITEHLIDPQRINWRALDIDVRSFNPKTYIQFSPLPSQAFQQWFQRFQSLWQKTAKA